MNAREASQLSIGQMVEFPDGRIARVQMQDSVNQQVRLVFLSEIQPPTIMPPPHPEQLETEEQRQQRQAKRSNEPAPVPEPDLTAPQVGIVRWEDVAINMIEALEEG